MKLSVLERLLILNVLPREGSARDWKVIDKLRRDIGFGDEEIKTVNLREEPDGNGQVITRWDSGAPDKEIEIGEVGREIIKKAVEELDKQKKINAENIGLWRKFVEGEGL
jgi:hypothetical protein